MRPYIVIVAYALLALIVVPVFPHFVSPSETARWLADASIVENQTFEVTSLLPIIGGSFEDLAVIGGRSYSNKAPGSSLLTLPGYLIARPFAGPPSGSSMRTSIDLMRITGATIPMLALALLFVWLARRWNADDERTTFVIWLLVFATPLFAYGFLLFSHALVTAALFGAWVLLFIAPSRDGHRNDWLAGALIGLAVACEYPVAIAAVVLLAGIARDWRRLARVVAAGAPFAIALALYHYINFGSIWTTPYAFGTSATYRRMLTGGFFGIHLPSPVRLLQILLDPGVGLLVFAPVLILAIPAFKTARQSLEAAAWWTMLLVPVSLLLLYAGYEGWAGGWNVGPRYVLPVVPFLIAPMLLRRGSGAESLLAGMGACAVTLATLVFPFPPRDFPFPWMSLDLPLLGAGLVAPNLLHLVSRPLAIAVPFGIVLIAAAIAIRHTKTALYAIAGVLAAIVIGTQAARLSPPPLMNLERAYIAEVYFERKGALSGNVPRSLLRRRDRDRALPPPPWPF